MSTCSTALAIAGFAALRRAKTLAGIAKRLGLLEGNHGRRAARLGMQHGEQSEDLARAVHGEHRDIAERRRDARGKTPAADAVHTVTHVTLVEDDLAPAELAPAPGLTELLLGNSCEDVDGHASTLPRL